MVAAGISYAVCLSLLLGTSHALYSNASDARADSSSIYRPSSQTWSSHHVNEVLSTSESSINLADASATRLGSYILAGLGISASEVVNGDNLATDSSIGSVATSPTISSSLLVGTTNTLGQWRSISIDSINRTGTATDLSPKPTTPYRPSTVVVPALNVTNDRSRVPDSSSTGSQQPSANATSAPWNIPPVSMRILDPSSNATFSNFSILLIAPSGSGLQYAARCASLSSSWWVESMLWASYTGDYSLFNSSFSYSDEWIESDVETAPITYTSCRNEPGTLGEIGGGVQTVSYSMVTEILSGYEEVSIFDPITKPLPTCSSPSAGCDNLYIDYAASVTSRYAAPSLSQPKEPCCDPDPALTSSLYCKQCNIVAVKASLMFWPSAAIGDPCDRSRSFVTATPTITGPPNTVVHNGITYTSPSIYISVPIVVGYAPSIGYCGDQHRGILISMRPEELSSVRFSRYPYGSKPQTPTRSAAGYYPSVYDDLLGAVLFEAYDSTVDWQINDTLIQDWDFHPQLVTPAQLRLLDPAWANCDLLLQGVVDPPLPLMPAATVAKPSLGPAATTTATGSISTLSTVAKPQVTPGDPQASNTRAQTSPTSKNEAPGGPVVTSSAAVSMAKPGFSASIPTVKSSTVDVGVVIVSIIVQVT